MLNFRAMTLLALTAGAAPALAQTIQTEPLPALRPPPPASPPARPGNDIGTGQSLPTSNTASNIGPADTHAVIAPRLPAPEIGEDAPPGAFLRAARISLAAGRTGEAQESLERAETRALDRSVALGTTGRPSGQSLVRQITDALAALSTGDRSRTMTLIDIALRDPEANAPAR
jgi:hypothetical protein